MAEANQIVWEIKHGKVFIYEQSNRTALSLRIEFEATSEGFRDTKAECIDACDDLTDPASIEYLQGVAGAIEQARQSWQESLDSADPAP